MAEAIFLTASSSRKSFMVCPSTSESSSLPRSHPLHFRHQGCHHPTPHPQCSQHHPHCLFQLQLPSCQLHPCSLPPHTGQLPFHHYWESAFLFAGPWGHGSKHSRISIWDNTVSSRPLGASKLSCSVSHVVRVA